MSNRQPTPCPTHAMEEPTMVYKRGSKIKVDGNRFDYKIVEAAELEGALKDDGWFRTPAEALEGVPSDNEGPTRDELKLMAEQLGVEYPSNISTKKLAELVDEATGG